MAAPPPEEGPASRPGCLPRRLPRKRAASHRRTRRESYSSLPLSGVDTAQRAKVTKWRFPRRRLPQGPGAWAGRSGALRRGLTGGVGAEPRLGPGRRVRLLAGVSWRLIIHGAGRLCVGVQKFPRWLRERESSGVPPCPVRSSALNE